MAKRYFVFFGLIAIVSISLGCAGPSRVEMDYGTSHKLAKFNQTLNPEAEKNREPVTGFDGGAAQGVIGRYHKGFEEKTPAPTYVFSISTGGK